MVDDKPRLGMRYPADPFTLAYLDLNTGPDPFSPTVHGLVSDESMEGAKVIFTPQVNLKLFDCVRIKVGDLPIAEAEVRWLKTFDNSAVVAGFFYLLDK